MPDILVSLPVDITRRLPTVFYMQVKEICAMLQGELDGHANTSFRVTRDSLDNPMLGLDNLADVLNEVILDMENGLRGFRQILRSVNALTVNKDFVDQMPPLDRLSKDLPV